MPRPFLIAGAVLALALAAAWAAGAGAWVAAAAQDAARAAQDALAGALRALRSGQPGALAALLGVCLAYGVAHAAGPGHGKALIGGYGLARRVPLARLAALALAASLAQATTAVALVAGGAALFDLTRAELGRIAEAVLPPFGHAAIALLGLWLVWRGVRGLARARRARGEGGAAPWDLRRAAQASGAGRPPRLACAQDAACARDVRAQDGPRDRDACERDACDRDACDQGVRDRDACGHRHGPTLAEVAALTGWRDAALLIGAVALRPCAGAVFLLVLTWQLGLLPAGIAGAYAMGAGTAVVTVGTAALSVWAREGALAASPRAARAAALLPGVEVVAGAAIAAAGLWLLAGGG